MMQRREFLRVAAVGAVTSAAAVQSATGKPSAASPLAAGFTLPALPYAYDALEPAIDAETMTIHHTKHHQAYVDNLNKSLAGQDAWLSLTPDELMLKINEVPEAVRGAVRNNGGGHWNHDFFWKIMQPAGASPGPEGELLRALNASFGDFANFQKEFLAASLARFGSGWVWLIPGKKTALEIVSSPNQDNPLMGGGPRPILGIDVWEHAYYLKYKNLRAKYVEAWFTVLNWKQIAANYEQAKA